jgi:acylglycerol lipase
MQAQATVAKTTLGSDKKIYQGVIQPRSFPGLPEGWVSEWETFASSDGKLQLFQVCHHPANWQSHKVLVILHGVGEHGGRYLHFPHYLQHDVGAVYALDHRGHGRSEGLRGHAENFDLIVDDAALAIRRIDEQLRKRFGRSEIHLMGHSMGGLITLRMLLLHSGLPLQSVTVSAPLLGILVPLAVSKRAAAQVLARVWGSLHMSTEVDAKTLSHDPEVAEAYVADRLVHNKGTPRFYVELVRAIADTVRRDSGIDVPLQMLIPLQDQVVDSEIAMKFFRELKLREKQLRTYPGFYHESFNEIGKEQAFEDLRTWINTHSPSSSAN